MEYRIRRPSDSEVRWIFGRGRLIRDFQGRAVRYSGIDIDITERKAGETALAELNRELERRVCERTAALEAEIARRAETEAQLRHAQKMETIGQLAGGIAHDFNNLLTVIGSTLETLEQNLPKDQERLHRLAEAAMRGTERAALLTNRLLALARREPLEPKLSNVDRLILGMHELLHRVLEAANPRVAIGGGASAGICRSERPGGRHPQPSPQRPRRNAGVRQADDRNRLRNPAR